MVGREVGSHRPPNPVVLKEVRRERGELESRRLAGRRHLLLTPETSGARLDKGVKFGDEVGTARIRRLGVAARLIPQRFEPDEWIRVRRVDVSDRADEVGRHRGPAELVMQRCEADQLDSGDDAPPGLVPACVELGADCVAKVVHRPDRCRVEPDDHPAHNIGVDELDVRDGVCLDRNDRNAPRLGLAWIAPLRIAGVDHAGRRPSHHATGVDVTECPVVHA